MELQIKGKPYAKGLLNLADVRELLKRTLDFKAILDSCMFFEFNQKEKDIPNDILRTLVWGSLDWGSFLENMKKTTLAEVTFDFYVVKYKDWIKFYPGTMTKEGKLNFKEVKEKGDITIFRQNMIQMVDFDVRNFISSMQYNNIDEEGNMINWKIKKR